MAKSLLLNILVEYLGKYVEGLNSENLQVGVWSGKIELLNLKLKSTALDNLHLPIKVTRGSLKKLKLKIPWAHLESKPVRVILEGIYLQASPVDVTQLSPEECLELVHVSKLSKLKEIEDAILSTINSNMGFEDKAMKVSYIQQLTTKIVDNIEITLTDLHIRYEDQLSLSDSAFSAGITIDSLTLAAADENWISAFITRAKELKKDSNATQVAALVRKLGTLDNITVYWNAESMTFSDMDYAEWERTMHNLIYTNADSELYATKKHSDTMYILAPPNSLTVKIVEREMSNEVIPKVEVTVESSTLPLHFDKLHYEQILGITDVFAQMQSRLQMALYRPRQRATVDPRSWWKYAYKLVTGKDPLVSNRVELMRLCMRERKLYISLVKTRRLNIEAGKHIPLTATQLDELKRIEESLPLGALLVFHQIAVKDAVATMIKGSPHDKSVVSSNSKIYSKVGGELSTEKSKATLSAESKSSLSFSSFFSFKKPEKIKKGDEEDEELLRKLEAKFLSTQLPTEDSSQFSLRIIIVTSLTLNLCYDYLPVALLKMSLKSQMEMKQSNFAMSFALNDFSVEDTCTFKPFNRYIISMWDHPTITRKRTDCNIKHVATSYASNSPPQLVISFESKPAKEVLMISALPLQISWNEKCLVKLVGLFIDRSDDNNVGGSSELYSLSNADKRMLASMKDKFASEAAVSFESTLELFVEVDAPIIIIPENSQEDSGYLLLDSGYLTLKALFDHSGMDWDIQLTDINVGMPTCFADYTTTLENETYLVKPFNIQFQFDNRNQKECDLGINAAALPSITAQFDAKKIIRLLAVINVIIASFDFAAINAQRVLSRRRESFSSLVTPSAKQVKPVARRASSNSSHLKAAWVDTQLLHRISVRATVKIPLLSVSLAVENDHVVELCLQNIESLILQRVQDINVQVSISGLGLKDTLRPPDDGDVIWTPIENETENSITSFSYRVIYSIASPLYDGYQQEISIFVPKLCVSISDDTINQMAPFVRNITTYFNQYLEGQKHLANLNASQQTVPELERLISSTIESHPPQSTLDSALNGVHLVVSIDGICLYLLCPLAPTADSMIDKDDRYNESAFCLSVSNIYADLHMGELTKIDAYLTSLSINDTRKWSQKYFYRTLICKSSEFINLQCFDTSDNGLDIDKSIHEAISEGVQKLLSVTFDQKNKNEIILDICLRDITSVIAVDLFLDLVNMIMGIVTAVNDLIASMAVDTKSSASVKEIKPRRKKSIRSSFSMNLSPQEDLSSTSGGSGDNSNETTPTKLIEADTIKSIQVSVKLINPLLLLLDDPAVASSRAIVSRCKLSFYYHYDLINPATMEAKETMHGSLRNAEIFVLTDMMKIGTTPHQIIEPTGIDFHYKRSMERNIEFLAFISLNTENIHGRVSLNDIILATSILNRASLVRTTSQSAKDNDSDIQSLDAADYYPSFSEDTTKKKILPSNSQKPEEKSITVFTLKVNLGKIHLVLVNDFSGQNVPILRAVFDSAEFNATGSIEDFSGEGSLFLSADYYNTSVSSWEPVVEQWHPFVSVCRGIKGISVEISNEYTLQLNISGAFCMCLYNASALMSRIGQEGSYTSRTQVNPLTIVNHLGIPIELYDGKTKTIVLLLDNAEMKRIPPIDSKTVQGRSVSRSARQYPSEYEIRLVGPMKDLMFPISHLPLSSNKPRAYTFHPLNELLSKTVTYGEPIVEDAYENSRYYPLLSNWGPPWTQLGDPGEWTDGRGKGNRDPQHIKLPMNWEWVEPKWRVDMSGEIGKNIDSEGWEYSINFNSFSLTNPRRSKQPMDSVRRRRWLRSRVPMNMTAETDPEKILRPLPVLWDVKMKPDGSREIFVRSPLQFRNEMSFLLEIELTGSDKTPKFVKAFDVSEKSTLFIPITHFEVKYIRMRPKHFLYDWSGYINCKLFEMGTHIQCEGTNLHDLYMVASVFQDNKSTVINCSPQAVLMNYLPVDMSYRLLNTQLESGILRAGGRVDIAHVDFRRPVSATIDIGSYTCKNPVVMSIANIINEQIIELISSNDDQELISTVTMSLNSHSGLDIVVLSKFAIVDLSDSRILLRSKKSRTSNLTLHRDYFERRTYRRVWAGNQQKVPASITAQDCWIYGLHGLTLFHAFDSKISLGANEGSAWQHDISLLSLGPSKSSIAITDRQSNILYSFAASLKPMDGIYRGTQLLKLVPCFEIVNCMDENIYIHQNGDDNSHSTSSTVDSFYVKPKSSYGLSKLNASKSTVMKLKSESSSWSVGSIDINEIGTTLLILPNTSDEAYYGCNLIIAHIEVKFSSPADNSYMKVIIWRSVIHPPTLKPSNLLGNGGKKKSSTHSAVALSIKNDTDFPLVVYQAGMDHIATTLGIDKLKFDLCVPPGKWEPYGWTDQNAKTILAVGIGTSSYDLLGAASHVDVLQIGQVSQLDTSQVSHMSSSGTLFIVIKTFRGGKVVHVFAQPPEYSTVQPSPKYLSSFDEKTPSQPSEEFSFRIYFNSIGLSIIAEKPQRREFLSLYVEKVELTYQQMVDNETNSPATFFQFMILDIQIDNYSESVVYPVLLNSFNSMEKKNYVKYKNTNDPHFFVASMLIVTPRGQKTPVVKLCVLRVLEIKLSIDSATILIYFSDLHDNLFIDSYHEMQEDHQSVELYIKEYNEKLLASVLADGNVNIDEVLESAQTTKIYFESLVLHPVKITLTFVPVNYSRQSSFASSIMSKYPWINIIQNIAAVDEFEIKINSFIVKNAMESIDSLGSRVISKVLRDLQLHLVLIAGSLFGSLSFLGKPAGLVKNIGDGVQDFFYEPYLGLMQSPTGFVIGVGKGTGSLLAGVASGVLSSTATIVGTASGGVSSGAALFTGDEKYAAKRQEKLRELKASHGGVLSGLVAGGESVVTGFVSGISGLVTKPVEEVQKSGALGIFKGVGLGLVGVAMKPVIGVTDGISSVASGVTQQIAKATSDSLVVSNARPQRAFERSVIDDADLVLVPVDIYAAEAQQFILRLAKSRNYSDAFVACVSLGFSRETVEPTRPYAVCLSDVYIFLLNRDCICLLQIPFGDVSHFEQMSDIRIDLIVYRNRSMSTSSSSSRYTASTSSTTNANCLSESIYCASKSHSSRLYSTLSRYAQRMGNPSAIQSKTSSNDAASVGDVNSIASAPSPRATNGSRKDGSRADSDGFTPASSTNNKSDNNNSSTNSGRFLPALSISKVSTESYQFGTANSIQFPNVSLSNSDIIQRARESFLQQRPLHDINDAQSRNTYQRDLDWKVWLLISNWRSNHFIFHPSRCLACLIINYSPNQVQIVDVKLKEGENLAIIGVNLSFEPDSRTLLSHGGSAVVFIYGYAPSLTDLAHVKVKIVTSAFTAEVSTRKNRMDCEGTAGHTAGYLEKSQTDWWAKCVICVFT